MTSGPRTIPLRRLRRWLATHSLPPEDAARDRKDLQAALIVVAPPPPLLLLRDQWRAMSPSETPTVVARPTSTYSALHLGANTSAGADKDCNRALLLGKDGSILVTVPATSC